MEDNLNKNMEDDFEKQNGRRPQAQLKKSTLNWL
jgi:hypothetical protein